MQLLYFIALHGTRPLISLYAHSLGASVTVIGFLVSSYALFPMLMAVQIGRLLDRFGARKMTFFGTGGILTALMLPVIFPNMVFLFVSQFLMGFFQLCVIVSLQKTVGNFPGDRDKNIAAFSMVGSLGEFIGPLVHGFSYDHFGFQISFVFAASFVLMALILVFSLRPGSWNLGKSVPGGDYGQSSAWIMLKQVNLRKAMVLSGLVLYSKDLFVAYFPVYGTGLGMSAGKIGLILSIAAGMSIAVRMSQFWLVRMFGRGKVLLVTLLISGLAFILIPMTSFPLILAIIAAILGAGLGLGQPLSLVYTLNMSPPSRQGEVLGMRLTFNRGSQFIAPFLFGGIGGFAGVSPIFWVSGSLMLLGAYFTRMSNDPEPQAK